MHTAADEEVKGPHLTIFAFRISLAKESPMLLQAHKMPLALQLKTCTAD